MCKQQRDELLNQIEMFFSFGLASLLVAALHWHGYSSGGWGNSADWIARLVDALILIFAIWWLLRKIKMSLIRKVLCEILAVFILGLEIWLGHFTISYAVFLFVFLGSVLYSVLLGTYYFWNNWVTKTFPRIDFNKVIDRGTYARQVMWLGLLWAGTLATWSEIRNHIKGALPDIVLIISALIVGILTYAWLRSIWQDKHETS